MLMMSSVQVDQTLPSLFARFDREELRRKFQSGKPIPNMCIDDFLDPAFAQEIAAAYPTFEDVRKVGREFTAVNEKGKVQVTDASKFPPAVAELNRLLAAPEFLADLSYITGIPNLLADPGLAGGGIHQTGSRGHLDVHVDFNFHNELLAHRRLNVLIYLNQGWLEAWGGAFELWDKDVKVCHHRLSPLFNRMAIFETNEVSFHGVTAVTCPPDAARRSFATYYYTKEAPADWDGQKHGTIFRARPDERIKGKLLMPGEKVGNWFKHQIDRVKYKVFGPPKK